MSSLFERLGGAVAVEAVVESFHRKVLVDERIGAFFDDVDMDRQLQKQQGALIEGVAIEELTARAERLKGYQTQARYAVADSYDRASQVQGATASPGGSAGEGK